VVTAVDTQARWDGEAPPMPRRVVVVAPHPDDEVLGAAGLLQRMQTLAIPISIVAVTDGEASHPRSQHITPAELRGRRDAERRAALATLGVTVDLLRLGLPDGAVERHEDRLACALVPLVGEGVAVIAPWCRDGHPDHEATARAARAVCAQGRADLWEVPIWAKVRAGLQEDRPPGHSTLVLSPATLARKRAAAACFESQLHPLGPSVVDGPVVHADELAVLLDGREELLWR